MKTHAAPTAEMIAARTALRTALGLTTPEGSWYVTACKRYGTHKISTEPTCALCRKAVSA